MILSQFTKSSVALFLKSGMILSSLSFFILLGSIRTFGQDSQFRLCVIPDTIKIPFSSATISENSEQLWFRLSIISDLNIQILDSIAFTGISKSEHIKFRQIFYNVALQSTDYRPLSMFTDWKEDFGRYYEFECSVLDSLKSIGCIAFIKGPSGKVLKEEVSIPISRFRQKSDLIIPLKGLFYIGSTFITEVEGHQEYSQAYAYVDSNCEFLTNKQ